MKNASNIRINASAVEEGTAILTRRDFKVRIDYFLHGSDIAEIR